MNHKALAIVPSVAFMAVILFAVIGVLTPILADAADPPAFGPNC
jgi:hypothetical protein